MKEPSATAPRVVDHSLVQRLADGLGDAALHWPATISGLITRPTSS